MQTVIETASGRALYLFDDAATVTIMDRGMTSPLRALDIRPDTHIVVQGVPQPQTWAGGALQWDGAAWVALDQAALDAAVDAAKTTRKSEATSRRYTTETSGVTLADGTVVATDRESQALIHGAYTRAKENATATFDFKAATGWKTVDAATMVAIGDAVFAHVQECFSKEKMLHDQIDACLTATDVAAVDIEGVW